MTTRIDPYELKNKKVMLVGCTVIRIMERVYYYIHVIFAKVFFIYKNVDHLFIRF